MIKMCVAEARLADGSLAALSMWQDKTHCAYRATVQTPAAEAEALDDMARNPNDRSLDRFDAAGQRGCYESIGSTQYGISRDDARSMALEDMAAWFALNHNSIEPHPGQDKHEIMRVALANGDEVCVTWTPDGRRGQLEATRQTPRDLVESERPLVGQVADPQRFAHDRATHPYDEDVAHADGENVSPLCQDAARAFAYRDAALMLLGMRDPAVWTPRAEEELTQRLLAEADAAWDANDWDKYRKFTDMSTPQFGEPAQGWPQTASTCADAANPKVVMDEARDVPPTRPQTNALAAKRVNRSAEPGMRM